METEYFINFNIFTDGASGHANVTFTSHNSNLLTIGANQTGGVGIVIPGLNSHDGVVADESHMLIDRPYETRGVPVTQEQFLTILQYSQSQLNQTYDYNLFNLAGGRSCTAFIKQIYEMTGHVGQPGYLFSGSGLTVLEDALVLLQLPQATNGWSNPTSPVDSYAIGDITPFANQGVFIHQLTANDALNFHHAFVGEQYDAAITQLANSSLGKVTIYYAHPDGYVVEQTLRRGGDRGDGFEVLVLEKLLDQEGNVAPKNIAENYLESPGRIWKFTLEGTTVSDIESSKKCFVSGTLISMWPLDAGLRPDVDGLYDKEVVLANVWQKPIEEITADDWVLSFDQDGNLKPGKVARTMSKDVKIVLDFFGTGVTPGHVYYRPDSTKAHKFETLIDILRDDGVIEASNGAKIRAATGLPIDDPRDGYVWAVTGNKRPDGSVEIKDNGKLRLGTRFITDGGRDLCIADLVAAGGGTITDDGLIRVCNDIEGVPFHWEGGDILPKPEDYVLKRSGITLVAIYQAAEWEGQHPHMSPPLVSEGGPVQPMSQQERQFMPRNESMILNEATTLGTVIKQQGQSDNKSRQVH